MKSFIIALWILLGLCAVICPYSTIVFADNEDEKKEPKVDEKKEKPKLTEEQKAERRKALQEARKPGTLLKRAQGKIDEYCEEMSTILLKSIVFYGVNEDSELDIRVFVEFKDGSLGIYYAGPNPDKDAWMVFDKSKMEDIERIANEQGHR